jgi:hypothetical protein
MNKLLPQREYDFLNLHIKRKIVLDQTIISDINEAVSVIETYKLECLVWTFENCPLEELKYYVPKGKEELVVVCHKAHTYLPFRLTFDNGDCSVDAESNVELNFHPEYAIHIILNQHTEQDK